MNDDRTVRSEGYWDDEFERSGGQARPFVVSEADDLMFQAIDYAVSAGACADAARSRPAEKQTWNAIADAKSRQSRTALAAWLATQRGE